MLTANINLNYWELHSGHRIVTPFSNLYNNDKSKKKEFSSKVMWGLFLYCSPSKLNPMHNMTKKEREEELLIDYLTDEQFQLVKQFEKQYEDFTLSYFQKRFRFYQNILEQREEYIGTLTYEKHPDRLDDMLVKTKKIWDEFMKIKKELEVEENEGTAQGGREESASEKGLL